MSVQIQIRRGTAAQWTSANPLLAIGEIGFETDTRKIKIGNGVTAWNSLSYAQAHDTSLFNGEAASFYASRAGTETLTNKTISGSDNTITNIANNSLTNSSVTLGTTTISLGATSTTLAGLTSVTSTSFVGALTGNASTATALQTARTINGVSFNGTANITTTTAGTGITVTGAEVALASGVVTPGTYKSVTVDTYGRVTTGTNPTTLSGYGITDAQPLDADLTAIAALSGTSGFLKKTDTDTWSLDTNTYLTGNQSITFSGDATGTGTTSVTLTLANSGVTAGSYGSSTAVPVITVDAKGRVTSVTTESISGSLTFTGDVTGTGTTGSSTALTLANSGVSAGEYTKLTVNAKGLVTSATTLLASDIPGLDANKIISGTIDAARLPSYVDDVLEFADFATFPATGETAKIYIALDTNKTYRWSGSTYIQIGGPLTWHKKTANYTALVTDYIIADTSAGSFTITLPASPSFGASVLIADGGDWETNNLTIARNGSTIEGLAEDLTFDIGNIQVHLLYNGTTWEVFSQTGPGVGVTDDTATDIVQYPVMGRNTSGLLEQSYISTNKLYYNPSTGTLNSTTFNSLSDIAYKTNVETVVNGLDVVKLLNPVSFNWKDTNKQAFGLIAQEVEVLLPSIVETTNGKKSVSYDQIIPFLISAIKELQQEIKTLKEAT